MKSFVLKCKSFHAYSTNHWLATKRANQKKIHGNDPGASLQAWTLLLNRYRYSKRKSRFKKVNVSGADLATVEKARRSLEEYKFLNWLDGFLRPKTTISNVSLMHLVEDYEDSSCSHAVADNESLRNRQQQINNHAKTKKEMQSKKCVAKLQPT